MRKHLVQYTVLRISLFGVMCLFVATCLPPHAAAAERLPLEKLEILDGGHPRAFFFRTTVSPAVYALTEADFLDVFSQLNGVMGVSMNYTDPTSKSKENNYLTAFKAAHPEQLVMLMTSERGRDPGFKGIDAYFDGHWLYFNGTHLTAPVSAADTVFHVGDTSVFAVDIGRYGNTNDDIGICMVDGEGYPDWSVAEQVRLLDIDDAAGTLTVERAILGSTAKAFPAGAYLAAHGADGPWGNPSNTQRSWYPNFSTTCPRDPDNGMKSFVDVHVDEIAAFFDPGASLEAYDGIQFDVLMWDLYPADGKNRDLDVDADGYGDDLVLNWENVYGKGVSDFVKRLRAKAVFGDERMITADNQGSSLQRSVQALNGAETEMFPKSGDIEMKDWSGGVNRMRFWNAGRTRQPHFKYIMFKTGEGDITQIEVPMSHVRLNFAMGPLLDCALTYFEEPEREEGEPVGIWDELIKGREKVKNWLGAPAGEVIDLAQDAPDLFEGKGIALPDDFVNDWSVWENGEGTVERYEHPQYGTCMKVTPAPPTGPDDINTVFTYTYKDAVSPDIPGGDLVAYVEVWCEPHEGYPTREVYMRCRERYDPGQSEEWVMTWMDETPFRAMAYWRGAGPTQVRFQFKLNRVEGTEPFYFRNLTVHNTQVAWARQFEDGAVLANPANNSAVFDLDALFPGMPLRRINGSSKQDPVTNDGTPVWGILMLEARDGMFLARDEFHRADINRDGFVNALDVQLAINAALGFTVTGYPDVDRSDAVDAVDVQMTVNAALGLW